MLLPLLRGVLYKLISTVVKLVFLLITNHSKMPGAARVSDKFLCPLFTQAGLVPVPHVSGTALVGMPTVLINNLPAITVGVGALLCNGGHPDTPAKGSTTVLIGGSPAVRAGDTTQLQGTILPPCSTDVIIGG